MQIPFNRLFLTGRELELIKDAINRESITGAGYYTRMAQQWLEEKLLADKVFLTTSATGALEMAVLLCGLKPGDEVIMPSFTFVSTANAVLRSGARPIFAEINAQTFNLDVEDVARRINHNTRAIIPVHYAGVACDMDALLNLARSRDITIIEDAAQALNATYKGSYLGTIGELGCYSFHGTKNYTCGEGGALVINQAELKERAEVIWEKGTDRQRFLAGEVDRYTWRDIGSSFAPSDILAAFLCAQLQETSTITNRRQRVYQRYYRELKPLQEEGLLQLPNIPDYAEPNYHIFYIVLPSPVRRNMVMVELHNRGIAATFHFVPLHTSPMGARLGYKAGDFPLTEEFSNRLLRLPIYPDMSDTEQEYVIEQLRECLEQFSHD
ncbi:dTDP-4-amino-4,6-dideoxygalactose transaminase [Syntrophomonas erecta subsp. sporosyntropha]